MQTSSSHSTKCSRTSKGADAGKLRVAVAIAMPSPRSSQFVDVEEKGKEKAVEEEAPPLYLGVADLPWHAEKVEKS